MEVKAMADSIRSTYSDSTNAARATVKGTKIMKPGNDMDKNAFLRILSAELTNQDPMNAKDSTQYVTQMAQFASMEQMTNLNNTMSTYAANALVGKQVVTRINDIDGTPYSGIVRDITNKSGQIKVGVEVNKNGKTEMWDFDYNEIATVKEASNYTLDNLSGNTALLTAASMIGKKAELNIKGSEDKNITGIVKGMIREGGVVKVRVEAETSGELMTVTLDSINKLEML
jgi:flagellar basal-body rod modification protein FlgD